MMRNRRAVGFTSPAIAMEGCAAAARCASALRQCAHCEAKASLAFHTPPMTSPPRERMAQQLKECDKGSTARRREALVQTVTDRGAFAELVRIKRPSSGPDGDIDVFSPLQMSTGGGDLGGDIELSDMRVG